LYPHPIVTVASPSVEVEVLALLVPKTATVREEIVASAAVAKILPVVGCKI
jgi:hypothetical protein